MEKIIKNIIGLFIVVSILSLHIFAQEVNNGENLSGKTHDTNNITSNSTLFSVKEIKVEDDRTLIIVFNTGLAKEPVEIELYTKDGKNISVNNLEFVNFTGTNDTVKITLSNTVKGGNEYTLIVKEAISTNGIILHQTLQDGGNVVFVPENVKKTESNKNNEQLLKEFFDNQLKNKHPASENSSNGSNNNVDKNDVSKYSNVELTVNSNNTVNITDTSKTQSKDTINNTKSKAGVLLKNSVPKTGVSTFILYGLIIVLITFFILYKIIKILKYKQ